MLGLAQRVLINSGMRSIYLPYCVAMEYMEPEEPLGAQQPTYPGTAGAHSSKTVEASAFEAGVHMAVANGWERVVIEGDTIAVVNRLCPEQPDCSVARSFLTEPRAMLRECPGFMVRHVAREVNRAAHELAHHCLGSSTSYYLGDVMSAFILSIVIKDAIYD
ncbi:hypothetical protein V6N13_126032 [Hibiscus sabdariffa]